MDTKLRLIETKKIIIGIIGMDTKLRLIDTEKSSYASLAWTQSSD
jgi:hypothetical protein